MARKRFPQQVSNLRSFFLTIFMYISWYFPALFFLIIVFLLLEPLGVDFELPRGPSHPQKTTSHNRKTAFLINRDLGFKNALEGAFGCLLGSFWWIWGTPWGFFWCQNGFELAPRISKTSFFGTLEPPGRPERAPKTKLRKQ